MTPEQNRREVLANDNDIRRQVPGILSDRVGVQKPQELRNEELWFRAMSK